MKEKDIQIKIRTILEQKGFLTFRANVGLLRTPDGRFIHTGLPKGFPDLFAIKNGKIYFFEVKKPKGKRGEEQYKMHKQLKEYGAIVGFCESVEDALKLIENI